MGIKMAYGIILVLCEESAGILGQSTFAEVELPLLKAKQPAEIKNVKYIGTLTR